MALRLRHLPLGLCQERDPSPRTSECRRCLFDCPHDVLVSPGLGGGSTHVAQDRQRRDRALPGPEILAREVPGGDLTKVVVYIVRGDGLDLAIRPHILE
jgi:hypothetical protein